MASSTKGAPVKYLAAADVRALFRLVGELRELGSQPLLWRRHLVDSLAALCGARATMAGEAIFELGARGRGGIRILQHETHGVAPSDGVAFKDNVCWNTHGRSRPADVEDIVWSRLYRSPVLAARRELVDDREWYRSEIANDFFRPFDCDDYIKSIVPLPNLRVHVHLKAFRAWNDHPFEDRERLLIELLNEELTREWTRAGPDGGPALSPRLRQVLTLLSAGASEKEVAAGLSISTGTVHNYVKTLYRAFGVHSRPQLLVAVAKKGPRVCLISEMTPPG